MCIKLIRTLLVGVLLIWTSSFAFASVHLATAADNSAKSVGVAWDSSPDANVVGYNLY